MPKKLQTLSPEDKRDLRKARKQARLARVGQKRQGDVETRTQKQVDENIAGRKRNVKTLLAGKQKHSIQYKISDYV